MMAATLHLAMHKHPHFFCFARDTVHLFNYNILYAMCLFLLMVKHVLQAYSQWNGYVQGQFTDLLLRRLFNAFKSIDILVSNVYNYYFKRCIDMGYEMCFGFFTTFNEIFYLLFGVLFKIIVNKGNVYVHCNK